MDTITDEFRCLLSADLCFDWVSSLVVVLLSSADPAVFTFLLRLAGLYVESRPVSGMLPASCLLELEPLC